MLKRIFTNWWVLAVGATLFLTLIVFILCGLVIGSALFLRWWLIGLVWLIFAGCAIWHVLAQRRAAKALTAVMVDPEPKDKEAEAIGEKMKGALAQAKTTGKNSLYQLPWYVIIGPPGAGKTTLIQKSGLRLITDEAAQGVGGTRNCDWWFTDDAVLIDTAGRYTSQDSQAERDAQGWAAFLGTLKKARPLQPLNGVIIAIGLDEVGTAPAEAIDRHVVQIRARIAELSRILGLELPIYVLFTKADLVAGFVEFFDDLSVEGRRAVVGHTLALRDEKPSLAELASGYDNMVQALADRIPARLQAEGDPIRRGAALSLPARFIDLRARIVRLLDGVFGVSAGINAAPGRLRGFYFTSGVQQGTPFDRLLGAMGATLGKGQRARAGTPRAFFVNRLLKDVVIAEAGLAGPDAKRRRRVRNLQIAAYAAMGLVGLLLLGAWIWSLTSNLGGQRQTAEATTAITNNARAIDPGDKVSPSATAGDVLDLLDAARDGLPYGVTKAAHPPLGERFGLYRTSLADESSRGYYDALQRYLLPRLIVTAERALTAGGTDPVAIYEPLKVYLMLGNRAGAKRDDSYILRWLEGELAARDFPGPENEATRARVLSHAKALLADTGRFGRQLTGPLLDPGLVEQAQASIAAMSPAERALALMKQQVTGEDWHLVGGALLRGEADAFGNPQEVNAAKVPYLFTKKGFQEGFVAQASTIGAALDKDRWMLGSGAAAATVLNPYELGQLYAAEYTKHWNAMLALPQPGDYARNPTALARIANQGASPLKKLTDQVVANTTRLMPKITAPTLPGGALGQLAGKAAMGQMKGSATTIAAQAIETNYLGLKDYAGEPLKGLLGALGKYQLALAQAAVAGGGGGGGGGGGSGGGGGGGASGAIAAAAVDLKVAAQNAGAAAPALGDFVTQVAGGSSKAAETTRTSELRDGYARSVVQACQAVFGKGYPFGTGSDLQTGDVSRATGIVTGFGQNQLGTYLARDGKMWHWISEPTVKNFTPESAHSFQRAEAVSQLMGGNLVLRISAAATNKGGVRLRAGGVPMDLNPGAGGERFSWSSGGSQIAEMAATNGGVAPPLREEGPWALFRVLDHAKKQVTGPAKYRFIFSPDSAVDIEVVGGPDPFAPDGPFALRCPAKL